MKLRKLLAIFLSITFLFTLLPAKAVHATTFRRGLPIGGETHMVVHNRGLRNPLTQGLFTGLIADWHMEFFISSQMASDVIRGMDTMSVISGVQGTLNDATKIFKIMTGEIPFSIPDLYLKIFSYWMKQNIDFRAAVNQHDHGYGIILTMRGGSVDDGHVRGARSQLVPFSPTRHYEAAVVIDLWDIPDDRNGRMLRTMPRGTVVEVVGSRGDSFNNNRTWYLLNTGEWVLSGLLVPAIVMQDVFVNIWASPPEAGTVELSGYIGGIGNRFTYESPAQLRAVANDGWIFDGWFVDGINFSSRWNLTIWPREDMMIEARFSPHIPRGTQPAEPTPSPSPTPFNPQHEIPQINIGDFERRILELTNIERANHGLPPLAWNPVLADVARIHSQDMANMGRLSHVGSDGSQPLERVMQAGFSSRCYAAENISQRAIEGTSIGAFAGSNEQIDRMPEHIVAGWMNSPGHRQNILNPNVRHLGVGIAVVRQYEYEEIFHHRIQHLTRLEVFATQKFVEEFEDLG